jgi:hypothetical protein
MAERRMFSLKVVDTDNFLSMPISARLLYYDFGMRTDDDGFVSSPRKILRISNCSDDDFKLLIAKGYVIPFESGVIVITHWKMQNSIQKDRYKETIYMDEKSRLANNNGIYSLSDTVCIQTVSDSETQDRSVKLNQSKDNLSQSIVQSVDVPIEGIEDIIHENIEYELITANNPTDKIYIDEIVDIMLDCFISNVNIKIGNNEYSPEVVKSRLMKINSSHIEYILHCMSKNTQKVHNIKSYLRAVIFNAPTTMSSYYQAEVNHDLYGVG